MHTPWPAAPDAQPEGPNTPTDSSQSSPKGHGDTGQGCARILCLRGGDETGTGDNEDIQAWDHTSGHGAPNKGRDEEEQGREKDDNGESTQVTRVLIGDLPSARAREVRREVHHDANAEAGTNTGNNEAKIGGDKLIHDNPTKEEGEGDEQDTGAGGGGGGGDRGEGTIGRCN